MNARKLCSIAGYKKWEKFHFIIKKAMAIADIDDSYIFAKIKVPVKIGSGAIRLIDDYELNGNAVELIKKLTGASKPNGSIKVRSETHLIHQLKKYFQFKNIEFKFQFLIKSSGKSFIYDAMIGDSVLFEFDEEHHRYQKSQISIDQAKNLVAMNHGYGMLRAIITDDVIDIIIQIEKLLK